MSGQPFRLAEGGRIDRARKLRFVFDGKPLEGHAGDTLASALLADGVHLVARSFKYHRPRGIMSAGAEEPNAFVQIAMGGAGEPNARATQLELFDGLVAASMNCWPSLRHDLGAVSGALSALLPAGFYYKTFMGPPRFWRFYEWFIRRAAGLGHLPTDPDPQRYEKRFDHCDVLVVGAGPAGLSAALAAGRSGARVLLVDDQPEPGGRLLSEHRAIDGAPALTWVARAVAELGTMPEARLLSRATACGYFDHNLVTILERVADHLGPDAPAHLPRQRLWKVRAKQVVLATGAMERPLVFADNDRPGIMLASAAQAYVNRWAVLPGRQAVLLANNDGAYAAARDMHEAGISVAAVVDLRAEASETARNTGRALGIEVIAGHAVGGVRGTRRVEAVEVMRLDGGRLDAVARLIPCDLLCVSGGWSPAIHLFCQSGGRPRLDPGIAALVPDLSAQAERSAGAAAGGFALKDALAQGAAAGAAAAEAAGIAGTGVAVPASLAEDEPIAIDPLCILPAPPGRDGAKRFVDLQNDVTVADLALAVREGYGAVEHAKRYTTTGMGIDQGRTGNFNALAVLARETGQEIAALGVTTFRPPYTPIALGALAGRDRGEFLRPTRRLPLHAAHVAAGAVLEPVGLWQRPAWYERAGETMAEAVQRECLAVRNGVGLSDNSTLGKIDLQGRDAAALLDRVYANAWGSLKIGAARYGMMLREDGTILDDGVTARLGDHRYLMSTTSGNAEGVFLWLDEWLQCEWPDLQVFATPVTTAWATLNLAGPRARDVLAAAGTDIDVSRAAFPFMGVREGMVAGIRARVLRVSFTGELSYEISVPARHARTLWHALMEAGAAHGIAPFGTEAIHVLRAEKGFIALGLETDGTQTPLDLGMGWIVSKTKADFIGKRSLGLPELRRADRKQLVGLLPEDAQRVLPIGSQIVGRTLGAVTASTAIAGGGHVTSSYFSPVLGRSIAMALLEGGAARMGETVQVLVEGARVPAKVASPKFYDPEGARMNG